MDTLSYKTISANKANADKQWVLIDAENQVVGRLASKIAMRIRGKHKTNFTPHADCGDNVIVINTEKIQLTGKKMDEKLYVRYTGYPGGQKFTTAKDMLAKHPTMIIRKAVKGMLPKNRLSDAIIGNLHLYVGNEHPHAAQQPKAI